MKALRERRKKKNEKIKQLILVGDNFQTRRPTIRNDSIFQGVGNLKYLQQIDKKLRGE